jgi:hypothetical protein
MPGERSGQRVALLRRLAHVGGRYTFRPDGQGRLAQKAFKEGSIVVAVRRLHEKVLCASTWRPTRSPRGGQGTELASFTRELAPAQGRQAPAGRLA